MVRLSNRVLQITQHFFSLKYAPHPFPALRQYVAIILVGVRSPPAPYLCTGTSPESRRDC